MNLNDPETLFFHKGAWGGEWSETLKSQCALRGSTVVMECEFDSGFPRPTVTWFRAYNNYGKWKLNPLSQSGRFTYVRNSKDDCSLQINNVQQSDAGAYTVGFKTLLDSDTSSSYAILSVKGNYIPAVKVIFF